MHTSGTENISQVQAWLADVWVTATLACVMPPLEHNNNAIIYRERDLLGRPFSAPGVEGREPGAAWYWNQVHHQ